MEGMNVASFGNQIIWGQPVTIGNKFTLVLGWSENFSLLFHVQAVSIRIQKYIPDCFLLHKSQMSFRRSLSYFDNARFQWLLLIYQLLNICRSKYAAIASSSNFFISVIACLMILGGAAPFSEGPEVAMGDQLEHDPQLHGGVVYIATLWIWTNKLLRDSHSHLLIQQSPFLCSKVNFSFR